jgi:signal transduction histidine kinase
LLDSAEGWPIQVDGQRVGTLILEGTAMMGSDGDALVAGVTRSVLIAALLAGLVAFLLGAVLIRQITSPLAALTEASQQIARGDRNVRVDVRSNDELGHLGQTFNGMVTALETQERLRRNLMADVAHELRTPLSGIQGTVEAMQDGVFPLTSENLENIHEQVMLVNRLVEDLRTLANAEAGQLPLQHAPVDLAAVATRFRAAHLYEAQQKCIDLALHIDEPLPSIQGDEERVGQILGNLLANALRHTPAGGVVDLSLSASNGYVEIAVVDSGEGIDPVDLPHLFDRFYRADHSRSRRSGGSGLGLAIVRQLVVAHGGQVYAESPPTGKTHGAGFYVHLPVERSHGSKKATFSG